VAERRRFAYRRSLDQDASTPVRHPVVVVGGGLVGLTLALELVTEGIGVVVLERNDTVSEGSRSICQAKRSLEIWNRFDGLGDRIRARGVTWNTGKVFLRDQLLYQFDLQPEGGQQMPAFVNLQQYLVEELLIEELLRRGGEIRWRHAAASVSQADDHVALEVETPEGAYALEADWLVACDGAGSGVRKQVGLVPEGEVFADKFLITDVRMRPGFPAERRFWFEPPFHRGQTALLHRQADDVWRIDLQLDPGADVEREREPARVTRRVRAVLGEGVDFELEWVSVYVFQCRSLDRYLHGRVIFAGDAAHQVSPFGARGGNAGIQDANNLAWKLARVVRGSAGASLLASYEAERIVGNRVDILNSTRATDFMTPKTRATRALRDAVLELAIGDTRFRAMVNSGRLSVPARYPDSPLNTPDQENDGFSGGVELGSPAVDAPLRVDGRPAWLLSLLGGRFVLLVLGRGEGLPETMSVAGEVVDVVRIDGERIVDPEGLARRRYDLRPGACRLFRPDQYLTARRSSFDAAWLDGAVRTAVGR